MITGEDEDEGEEAAEDEEKGCGTSGEGEVGVCSVDIFVCLVWFGLVDSGRKEGSRLGLVLLDGWIAW